MLNPLFLDTTNINLPEILECEPEYIDTRENKNNRQKDIENTQEKKPLEKTKSLESFDDL